GYVFRRESGGKPLPPGGPARHWVSPVKDPAGRAQVGVLVHYPRETTITGAQRDYLTGYVASFEEMMKGAGWSDPTRGYRGWIDVGSWMDYALIGAVSPNAAAYYRSVYWVKERDAGGQRGRLLMTPFWDFNIAFGNADFRQGWRIDLFTHELNLRNAGKCSPYVATPPGCPACVEGS